MLLMPHEEKIILDGVNNYNVTKSLGSYIIYLITVSNRLCYLCPF